MLGVDIVQGCEVTGITVDSGRVQGVDTTLGHVAAPRILMAVAGHASVLARKAGSSSRSTAPACRRW
jgi:sarcosine oxidase subunit beta